MNAALEIRKTPDGRIQARRIDGRPLTAEEREQARRMAASETAPQGRPWASRQQAGAPNRPRVDPISSTTAKSAPF